MRSRCQGSGCACRRRHLMANTAADTRGRLSPASGTASTFGSEVVPSPGLEAGTGLPGSRADASAPCCVESDHGAAVKSAWCTPAGGRGHPGCRVTLGGRSFRALLDSSRREGRPPPPAPYAMGSPRRRRRPRGAAPAATPSRSFPYRWVRGQCQGWATAGQAVLGGRRSSQRSRGPGAGSAAWRAVGLAMRWRGSAA